MLIRLPISLAQLNAGNDSQELKNKVTNQKNLQKVSIRV